jgi:recombination protein RecT
MTSTELTTDKKAATPAATVRATLEQMKPQLAMALPKHLTADRLIRVAMTAVQNTPKLLECDRTSLLSAIMTCAQLGLEPDGVLGQAYLIPFKVAGTMRVQFVPGYKGLIALARNSGEVKSISAQVVCEKDRFEYEFGLDEKLVHRPADGDRGEMTHVYAIARFKDGGHHWDVMTRAEVERIRDNSQGYKAALSASKKWNKPVNSPWVEHFDEMAKKTAIRRIAKYLPMDVQKAAFIAASYDTGAHTALDTSGEIVVFNKPEDEEEAQAERKTIEGKASTLDSFAGETIDAETGEVTTPEKPDPIAAARATLAACKTVADLDAAWDSLDVEVCRQIGADTFDDLRTKLEA